MRLFVGKLQVTSSIFLCNLYSSASLLICPVADNSAVFVQLFCAFFVGICHKSHVNHVVDHDLRTAGKNAVPVHPLFLGTAQYHVTPFTDTRFPEICNADRLRACLFRRLHDIYRILRLPPLRKARSFLHSPAYVSFFQTLPRRCFLTYFP